MFTTIRILVILAMSLITATSNLRLCAYLLGLIPFSFCKKSNKFILLRFLPISIIKFTLLMGLFYVIMKETTLINRHSDHLSYETPNHLVIVSTRMLCISITLIYDVILIFEKNLRKEKYCEVMNDLLSVSQLTIFNNLKHTTICQKLQIRELKIITIVILYASCVTYFAIISTTNNVIISLITFVYFNSHVLLIVIDCLYIGHLFVVMRCFLEYLINIIDIKSESISNVQLIQIHDRIGKVIQKLIKIHGLEIIASYIAVKFLISTAIYVAYALYNEFTNISIFGFYLVFTNASLLSVFTITWNLVKVQEMVS